MRRLLISVTMVVISLGTSTVAMAADTVTPDQPFPEALSLNLLRSLFNQAVDQLEDHVEISSQLNQTDSTPDHQRSLRFKYYPEGKSKSDRHVSAEGWFSSAPKSGQLDWHFRFRLPGEGVKGDPPRAEHPL